MGGPKVIAGRYKLLERIGEGGMGVVWRGYDLDLEEVVAIKFLREDLAGDISGRVCFRREAKLARRVTHPNVARVYEFGNDRELYYLTMEYIPGQSLYSVLTRKYSLSPRQVHRCALGLCRGLAAAHAAGIVHGDIKPSNILLSTRRGAVLTDFGIARAVSEVLGKGESVGGTPLYMAPEQILGGVLALQSDIYATGVVLFECLTGELPWPEVDLAELLPAKCGPELDLRARAPGLPDGWYRLISSCLRKDPAQRPANGRVLLGRLREVGAAAGQSTQGPTAHAWRPSAAARQGRHVGDTLDRLASHPSRDARGDAGSGPVLGARYRLLHLLGRRGPVAVHAGEDLDNGRQLAIRLYREFPFGAGQDPGGRARLATDPLYWDRDTHRAASCRPPVPAASSSSLACAEFADPDEDASQQSASASVSFTWAPAPTWSALFMRASLAMMLTTVAVRTAWTLLS